MSAFLGAARMREPGLGLFAVPSWQSDRQLDHILVSQSITVERVEVLSYAYSDHLPIAMDVRLPKGLRLKVKG